jgi:threonine synthase
VTPASGANGRSQTFTVFCTGCDAEMPSGFAPFCARCGSMTDVRYDLPNVQLTESPNPYVRFRDLLPVRDSALLPADAEPTPTVHAVRLGERVKMPWLYLKDETKLPTGTTKDRMAAVALAYLYERGVRGFCTSSTGNSSTAYAHAITRIPDLVMYLFTAADFADRLQVPETEQIVSFILRDATFVEAFDAARDFALANGLVSERGFFNLGRREGLKLAWLEAVDQVPRPIDWYFQAVSSAMGVYGVLRGAEQLHGLGRIDRLPRLACVQQDTCAPMVTAWESGSEVIRAQDIVERPVGIAKAILRGNPSAAYPPVRELVVRTNGTFVAVSEEEIRRARSWVEDDEGISPCFAAAAAVAGLIKLRGRDAVPAEDTVLVNLTGGERPAVASMGNVTWLKRSEEGWTPDGSGAPPGPSG